MIKMSLRLPSLLSVVSFHMLLSVAASKIYWNDLESLWRRNVESCETANWRASMNRPGFSKCPDTAPYITGLFRSPKRRFDYLGRLEEAQCCVALTDFPNRGIDKECYNSRWSFGVNNHWNLCKKGYFLNGILRRRGVYLTSIRSGRCCRPVGHPDNYGSCYDEDVTNTFDRRGMSACTNPGYYIAGLYKSGCNYLYCIETFKCCKMAGPKKPCRLKPCKNGGTCTEVDDSSFSCRCPSGYIGRTCETVIPSPCTPNPCQNGGECDIMGNRYSCRCKPEFGGPNCEHGQATCRAFGDPHYVTFDKRAYNFMGNCEYTLAQDCNGENRFTVVARSSRCGWGAATCTRDVTVYLHKTSPEYRIYWSRATLTVVINGQRYTSFPIKRPGFVMNNPSVLTTDIGLGVTWNFKYDVKVTVSGQYKNKMCGLCGDFNGDAKNDWPQSGLKCALPPSGCFPSEEKQEIIEKCNLMQDKTSPFAVCHSTVDPTTLISDCKYDTCRCDNPVKCLCDAVATYTKQCAAYGKVVDWRFEGTNLYQPLSECAKKCSNPGEIFTECGSSCVKTCRDLSRGIQCNEQCIPGCQCPGNKVLNEKQQCVPREECPCPYEGKVYQPGESVAVGNCKTCTCSGGAMSCVDDRECAGKGPCDSQPCKNGGICKSEGDDFACTCVGEYQGKTCEELKPKPCDSSPCKNNGICSNNGSSSFSCECVGYFKGPTCEVPIPKPCDSGPCKNGATCLQEGNAFHCKCTPDFSGETCEVPIPNACKSSPCKNNGTCINYKDTFVCKCTEEFMGETCEPPKGRPCDSGPCVNGGKCFDDGVTFFCRCPPNFIGNTCEGPKPKPCDSSPCKNAGTCTNNDDCSFSCTCTEDFKGETCEEPKSNACDTSPCKNGGTCIRYKEKFVCKCTEEYMGKTCEVPTTKPCDSSPCKNGASCINRCLSFECNCTEDFEGETCEEPKPNACDSSPCKNGGTCIRYKEKFVCKCTEEYTGKTCEVATAKPCDSSPCKNGASCINRCLSFECNCTEDFEGETCEEPKSKVCESSPCKNGGTCIPHKETFVCNCTKEFMGKTCEVPTAKPCDSSPCENGGTCINQCLSFECNCTENFEGETCEKERKPCQSNPCKNGGICRDVGDAYNCTCSGNFVGPECEVVKCETTKLDLLYLVDGSGSIRKVNFTKMQRFIEDLNTRFDIGQDKTRVALIQFGRPDEMTLAFNLGDKNNLEEVNEAVSVMQYKRYQTATGAALNKAREEIFNPSANPGDRPDVPDVLILFTDGQASDKPKTLQLTEAEKLKEKGVKIITVGLGRKVDQFRAELQIMASRYKDSDKPLFFEADFANLDSIANQLVNESCN